MGDFVHADLTGAVIGAAIEVHNTLGPGFLESVYETALARELELRGIPFARQVQVPIHYKEIVVGTHVLDLLVADKVVVELKVAKDLADIHTAIALSYLAATKLPLALLMNFSKRRLECKRVAL
ncbi:MAG TPA: GxxExxY protein [Symbiobacteriaceae bacterium]|jgi:GxxExxY protein|nr:GxxExxY protein [Symbiobacteriaceae bacterium]